MKKLRIFVLALLALVLVAVMSPLSALAAEPNLIANPSAETADATGQPTSWTKSSWGTNNAAYTYATNGFVGSKSLQITISSYTNGDAKWRFTPVTVSPSTKYTFADAYKSTTSTEIVNEYTDTAGKVTYQWLATAPVSASWQSVNLSFTTPANVKTVSTFHLIMSAGTLQTDNFTLAKNTVATPGTILNPGQEDSYDGVTPMGWNRGSWGNNTAKFEYVNVNNPGTSRSTKVTVSNYKDGDAKWYFDPIALSGGKMYRISFWFKTNTTPHAVVQYTKKDGSVQFYGMSDPMPITNDKWTQYSNTFSVPLDAVSVTAFMYLSSNGYVMTDDYSLGNYTPVGFSRPLISLTFDDGEEDNATTMLPLVNSYGFKTTQCFATEFIEGNQANINKVLQFKNAGHEICSHTVTHPMLTTVTAVNLDYELQHSKQVLESITGQKIVDFASPYGNYNATVNAAIKKYYQAHRTVDEGYNSKDNLDAYRLKVQNMFSTTTAAQVQQWVDTAKATNTWLILVYHRVADDPDTYDTKIADFKAQLEIYKKSGITVKSYKDALAEVQAQK